MAIKINWNDLQKRFVGTTEIVRVYKAGYQVRPDTVPPVFDDYLCFTSVDSSCTIRLYTEGTPNPVNLETSYDKTNRTDYTIWGYITLNQWETIYMRNKSETQTRFSLWDYNWYRFSISGRCAASWDLTSLLCKYGTDTLNDYDFEALFGKITALQQRTCDLVTAPKLTATTLGGHCYSMLFAGCDLLTTAPTLPATTMAPYCYARMFSYCTGITTPPVLPATTLANYCYSGMFSLSWLTTAPTLPATTLYQWCYFDMFVRCSSLTALPSLPATTLPKVCYREMFYGCSNIKLSDTQTWEYQTPYRIPTTWTWTEWENPLVDMFYNTWGTFTWTPSINTTYYTSNTII